jgi:hypothetical protein
MRAAMVWTGAGNSLMASGLSDLPITFGKLQRLALSLIDGLHLLGRPCFADFYFCEWHGKGDS